MNKRHIRDPASRSTRRLHSYPADEIGFTPGRGQAQVRTWWGMAILALAMALLGLGSLVMLAAPLKQGRGLEWSALVLTVMTGLGVRYFVHLARAEYHAGRVRKERGSPESGA